MPNNDTTATPGRATPEPERDHITPGDLLSDDPEQSVDPAAIRTRTQSHIGPGTCAKIRDSLRGSDKDACHVAAGYGVEKDISRLRQHYQGRCGHDTTALPVRYDHGLQEWVTIMGGDTHE